MNGGLALGGAVGGQGGDGLIPFAGNTQVCPLVDCPFNTGGSIVVGHEHAVIQDLLLPCSGIGGREFGVNQALGIQLVQPDDNILHALVGAAELDDIVGVNKGVLGNTAPALAQTLNQTAGENHGNSNEKGKDIFTIKIRTGQGVCSQHCNNQVDSSANYSIQNGIPVSLPHHLIAQNRFIGVDVKALWEQRNLTGGNIGVPAEGGGQNKDKGIEHHDAQTDHKKNVKNLEDTP